MTGITGIKLQSLKQTQKHQLLIAGGGLAGGLLAWRLAELMPELDFLLIERGTRAGGNHTWCFHQHDLSPKALGWISPLVSASWTAYTVDFPGLKRQLNSGYFAIRSDDFATRLQNRLGQRLITGQTIQDLTDQQLLLADGTAFKAKSVLDARGPEAVKPECVGWQKFVGLELELSEPHGLQMPVLMDACVPQLGDFRFIYLLPWDHKHLLIEDTRYSVTPEMDADQAEALMLDYVQQRGWKVLKIRRRETGCLPLPLEREYAAEPEPLSLGLRSGLFHYVTGYSLPESVRLIEYLLGHAHQHHWQAQALEKLMSNYLQSWQTRQRYFLLLNRMLFRAAEPGQRWRVLARFYGLSENLIRRFYAGEMTLRDQIRLLAGRPPVSVSRALSCLAERSSR